MIIGRIIEGFYVDNLIFKCLSDHPKFKMGNRIVKEKEAWIKNIQNRKNKNKRACKYIDCKQRTKNENMVTRHCRSKTEKKVKSNFVFKNS